MAGQTLSDGHPYATTEQNTTGQIDPVLKFSPDEGVLLRVLNHMIKGDIAGPPVYYKLKDTNGNELPTDTFVTWQFQAPGQDDRTIIGRSRDNISPWNSQSITDQRDSDRIDSVKLPFDASPDGYVDVTHVDDLILSVDSSTQIDWSNSEFYLDAAYMREFQV